MLRLAADMDRVAAVAHVVLHGQLVLELLTQLIEVSDLQVGAQPHAALLWWQLSQDQSQQRGLAGTVRAHQADLVARKIVVEKFRTISRSP